MAMRGCGDMVSVSRLARLAALLLAALCLICSARAEAGIESWSALQDAIDSAASGDTIVLTGDVTAGEADTALVIPDGMKITLDLNGFTLDRNLKAHDGKSGAAIRVPSGAVLTITDSGEASTGVITGGNSSDGGGIRNRGTLILEGGRVTGNTAATAGGGIVNYGGLVITGGTVTGNTAGKWGGGIFNALRGYMTVDADTVSGNSAPRDADIRNTGSMKTVGGETVDSVAIMDYLDLLSVMPVLALLLILAFAVHMDKYLDKRQRKVMDIICALVFTLILQNYLENWLSHTSGGTLPRTLVSICGYAVRPAILAMLLYLVRPGRRYAAVWAVVGLNTAIYLTALFSPLTFSFPGNGKYKGGPLSQTCLIVSALLFVYLFCLTVSVFRPRQRRETWIPILVTALIGASVALDYTVEYNDQPVSFLTIAIAISCVFYYIWLHLQFVREHEDALRAGQRIRITMSQIQPHFLFNSLEVIRRVYRKEPEKADDALLKFERYLRGNMDSLAREEPIPFRTELEHTQTYLELEQLRFPDELHIDYDLRCMDFIIPSLTLQPLAENAVRHGVRGKKSGEGTVTISTREYENRYEVVVTDDGNGFDPNTIPQDDHSHIGLRNVRERLRYAGDELRIGTGPKGGTQAVIIIPKREQRGGVAQ